MDETLISSLSVCPWRSEGVNTDTSPSLSFLYPETQVGNVNEGEIAEGPNAAQQNFANPVSIETIWSLTIKRKWNE